MQLRKRNVKHFLRKKDSEWGEGPSIVYGVNGDGSHIHIDDIYKKGLRGNACGCLCGDCGEQLCAKTGKIMPFHFAHKAGSSCTGNGMTELHRLAQKIIHEDRKIFTPSLSVCGSVICVGRGCRNSNHRDLIDPLHLRYEDSLLEAGVHGTSRIADIILISGKKRLIVEVAVTSKCTKEKRREIRKSGIPAIEIDLSHIDRDISENDLRGIIQGFHYDSEILFKWINNPLYPAAKKEINESVRAENEIREKLRQDRIKEELIARYEESRQKKILNAEIQKAQRQNRARLDRQKAIRDEAEMIRKSRARYNIL